MKTIDVLSSETIVQLFYLLNTGYYRLLWDNTQSDYKDQELNAVIWSNLYCKGISAIWEGNKSKLYRHFLRFRPRIRFICERSAENETMQFGGRYGFGSVSVRIRCICETALTANSDFVASTPRLLTLSSDYVGLLVSGWLISAIVCEPNTDTQCDYIISYI